MSELGFLQMRWMDCYCLIYPQTSLIACSRIANVQHFTVVLASISSCFSSWCQAWARSYLLRNRSGTCIAWSGCPRRNGVCLHHSQHLDDAGRSELFVEPVRLLWSHWPLLGSEYTVKVVKASIGTYLVILSLLKVVTLLEGICFLTQAFDYGISIEHRLVFWVCVWIGFDWNFVWKQFSLGRFSHWLCCHWDVLHQPYRNSLLPISQEC